jgi:hypothetical protein
MTFSETLAVNWQAKLHSLGLRISSTVIYQQRKKHVCNICVNHPAFSAGNTTEKTLPSPILLCTLNCPLNASISALTMESPKPDPPDARLRDLSTL